MNDQIVELANPGLSIVMYPPSAVTELEEGCDYGATFPDGRDLIDYVNESRLAAVGVRFSSGEYWLHFSATLDGTVIAAARDHVRLGIEIDNQQLCVRGSDDLFRWTAKCPGEQIVSLENGFYEVTACMVPHRNDGLLRIFLHFARLPARPDLGYARLPELHCEAPV